MKIGRRNVLFVTPLLAAALSAAAPLSRADRLTPATPPEWFRDDAPAGAAPAGPPVATPAVAAPDAPPAVGPPVSPMPAVGGGIAPVATRPQPAPPAARPPGGYFPPIGTGNGSVGSRGFGPSDYPSGEIYNAVLAHARYVTANALFRRAETEVTNAYRDAERRFERSPELRRALTEEQDAYRQLNQTRYTALEAVYNNETYKRLSALRQDLTDRLEAGRSRHELPLDQILAMATLKMKYGTDMRVMEGDALNGEPSVKAAQDRLVASGARVAALRERHADELRADPDLLAARRNLEDARVARIAASAYANGTNWAGDLALDAYYYSRRPYAGYWPTPNGGGYDYGGGYGTNVRY